MNGGLQPFIVNLKYYARFLRTNNVEDAIGAVQHPKDGKKYTHQDYSKAERKKTIEICRNQNQGKVALLRWRKKPTSIAANMAFVILSREGEAIPPDLLLAVRENVEKWMDNSELYTADNGDIFDKYTWQYSVLKTEIGRRSIGTTMVAVFKKYAVEWNVSAKVKKESWEVDTEPWEVLKQRYKSRRRREIKDLEKRLAEPDIRKREKMEIIERLNKLQRKISGS